MKKLKLPKFFENKRNIILLITGGILIIIGITFAIISPTIRTERVVFTGTTTIDQTLTNKNNFTFTNKDDVSIYVSDDTQSYWGWKNEIKITDITEGVHTFEIHSMKNFIFFKLISAESKFFTVNFDYTQPKLAKITNVSDEYYIKETSFTFDTNELYISIAQITDKKEALLFAEDSDKPVCSFTKEEDTKTRHFTCPIKFEDNETLTKTVYAKDLAGNIYYFFKDQVIKYIEPVSLGCTIPQFTNQPELTVSCVVAKGGFYKTEDLREPITKGQKISKIISLQEGKNTITYKTFDDEDREFEDSYTVMLDTIKPIIVFDKLPTSVNYWDKFTINFHSNEYITGTVYVRPAAAEHKPNIFYNKTYYKKIELSEENKYSFEAPLDGKYSLVCYGGPEFGYAGCDTHATMLIIITLTDKAGNKTVEQRAIKVVGSEYDI